MSNQTEFQSLSQFADRVAIVVTDLNGLTSSIINEEVTAIDFDDDLTELFDILTKVEAVVSKLVELFGR